MPSLFQTFAISGDAVIGLVAVVVWVWLSVLGKRAKPDQKTQPPPMIPTPGDASNPQDELRKFFEDLEKGLKGPPPAEPAGPFPSESPAAPPPLPSRPTATLRPLPRRVVRRVQETQATTPAPMPAPVAPVPVAAVTPAMEDPQVTRLTRVTFPDIRLEGALAGTATATPQPGSMSRRLAMLRERDGLQKAILVSEVLGTPVGLRR